MIDVLVVDDSAFMRKALSMMLEKVEDFRVVGTAHNGLEAIQKVVELQPDVVTMDIEMPRLDGIAAVEHIMQRHPCPIVMVSSLTEEGADETLRALEAGAIDFIPKQHAQDSAPITKIQSLLLRKVRAAAGSNLHSYKNKGATTPFRLTPSRPQTSFPRARLLAIGISTGGPYALQEVIPRLPSSLPAPVVIVQHMPAYFTHSLAERLNDLSPLNVMEAEAGMPLIPGNVYIAAGGRHLTFTSLRGGVSIRTPQEPSPLLHKPSVDVMLASACNVFGGRVLATIMTGMGKDGLEGARRVRAAGGRVYVQDKTTSVVYGMPRVVVEAGLADGIFPLEELPEALAGALCDKEEVPAH